MISYLTSSIKQEDFDYVFNAHLRPVIWEDADNWQPELFDYLYEPLTQEQERLWGLTRLKAQLVSGPKFTLTRNQAWLWVLDRNTGKEHKVKLYPIRKPRDRYSRWMVDRYTLDRVPGLKKALSKTGLFRSVAEGTDIYLSRLVKAVQGEFVYFDEVVAPNDRLNIHHVNFKCCCDLVSNLIVLTAEEHQRIEIQRLLECREEYGLKMRVSFCGRMGVEADEDPF